ncbi:MAG: ion transporter, partial [bacterium]
MNDSANSMPRPALTGWRLKLYTIIFEADTVTGKQFDLVLVWSIVISLVVIMLDSMQEIHAQHKDMLNTVEWFFTILFTIEYVARLVCSPSPMRYAKSFLGVIDLLSILPSFVSLFLPEAYVLLDVRIL